MLSTPPLFTSIPTGDTEEEELVQIFESSLSTTEESDRSIAPLTLEHYHSGSPPLILIPSSLASKVQRFVWLGNSKDEGADEAVAAIFSKEAPPLASAELLIRAEAPALPEPVPCTSPVLFYARTNQTMITKKLAAFVEIAGADLVLKGSKEDLIAKLHAGHYCFGLGLIFSGLLANGEVDLKDWFKLLDELVSWNNTAKALEKKIQFNTQYTTLKQACKVILEYIVEAQTRNKQFKRFLPVWATNKKLFFSIKSEEAKYIQDTHLMSAKEFTPEVLADILDETNVENNIISLWAHPRSGPAQIIYNEDNREPVNSHAIKVAYVKGVWHIFDPLLGESITTTDKATAIHLLLRVAPVIVQVVIASMGEKIILTEKQKQHAGFYGFLKAYSAKTDAITYTPSPLVILDQENVDQAFEAYPEQAQNWLLLIIKAYGLENFSMMQKDIIIWALVDAKPSYLEIIDLLASLLQEKDAVGTDFLTLVKENNEEDWSHLCKAITANYGTDFLAACLTKDGAEEGEAKAGAGAVALPFRVVGEAKQEARTLSPEMKKGP